MPRVCGSVSWLGGGVSGWVFVPLDSKDWSYSECQSQAPSCLVTTSARLYLERKMILRVWGSHSAQAVNSTSPLVLQ